MTQREFDFDETNAKLNSDTNERQAALIADGLAEIIGTTRSRRPSRHRGYVARLRLIDRCKAELYLRRMSAALSQYDATPNAVTNGVAVFSNVTMQTENLDNATV